jgi:hypothetical protein
MPLSINFFFSNDNPQDGGMPWLDHGGSAEPVISRGHGPWCRIIYDNVIQRLLFFKRLRRTPNFDRLVDGYRILGLL